MVRAAKKTATVREYGWRNKRFSSVSAQEIGEEIEAIREGAGVVSPAAVVKQARKKKSAMHKLFTWDADVAAQRHWEFQARRILQSLTVREVVVHVEQVRRRPSETKVSVSSQARPSAVREPEPRIAYVAPVTGRNEYHSLESVVRDDELFKQVLKQATSQLHGLRVRLATLKEAHAELADVLSGIDGAIDAAHKILEAGNAVVK